MSEFPAAWGAHWKVTVPFSSVLAVTGSPGMAAGLGETHV